MALRLQKKSCGMCAYFSFNEQAVRQHVVRHHRFDPNFIVYCHSPGCGISYLNWKSYKSHVYRKHRMDLPVLGNEEEGIEIPHNEEHQNVRDQANEPPVPDNNLQEEPPLPVEPMSAQESQMWHAAKFLLHVRETGNISQSATCKIIDGVQYMTTNWCNAIKAEILKGVGDDHQVPSDHINDVFQTFENQGLFKGVNSKFLLDSFLIDQNQLILPQKVVLDTVPVWVKRPNFKIVYKEITYYYVPFKKSLTQLLNNDDILECVKSPMPHEDGYLNTFSDGDYYKSHPLYSANPEALMIIVYFDDIEISNPLGSKSKIHKLSMFYWTLGNIYPEFRSTLRAINLLAIVKNSNLRKYGVNKVLEPFISEIKMLESIDGMPIIVKGVQKNFRGALFFFTGDTLASNYVGGFKESPGFAHRPCRACMGTGNAIKKSFLEQDFMPRTAESYNNQCSDLEQEGLSREAQRFWSKTHGINERSILSSLEHFNIITCMVQDLMHVVIEGCLEMECREFLKYCVHSKAITILELNLKMNNFDYGHIVKDKPSPIDISHLDGKLRQNCAQIMTLGNILPFLLHNSISKDDERLENLVTLLQIVNIMLAYKLEHKDCALLKTMINVHHHRFAELYPNASITPKHHYMIHIPQQIHKFGPLRQQWCMRFEAAHCRIKLLASVVRNFKNPPLTMSYRYQALRCAELLTLPGDPSRKFLYSGDTVKSGQSMIIGNHPLANLCMDKLKVENPQERVLLPNKIEVQGTTYCKNYAVLTNDPEESLPEFASIETILTYGMDFLFICRKLNTVCFERSLNAYHVEPTENVSPVLLKELPFPHNLSMYNLNDKSYIILLHHRRTEYF